MISARLLQRIETHWETIAADVISHTKIDPNTPHHQDLESGELHARARDLVHSLGEWLMTGDRESLTDRYRQVGELRHKQGMPLSEVVYKVQLIELKVVDYIQNANAAQNAIEVYGELEMLRALHKFFAIVIHGLIMGYERAAARRELAASVQR